MSSVIPVNAAFRLRFLLNAVGDPSAASYQLEHKINAGSWTAVGTTGGVPLRIYPSSNIAAGAATSTTSQLTGGSGSFTAGRISDDTDALPSINIGSGGNTELEWCLYLNTNYLSDSDRVSFRISSAGTPLDTYGQTPTWQYLPDRASRIGAFDALVRSQSWFDNSASVEGWFDDDLITTASAPVGSFAAVWYQMMIGRHNV
jgi:hypothetical protein